MITYLNREVKFSVYLELKHRRGSLGWTEDGFTLPVPDKIFMHNTMYTEYDPVHNKLYIGHTTCYSMYPQNVTVMKQVMPVGILPQNGVYDPVPTKTFPPSELTMGAYCGVSMQALWYVVEAPRILKILTQQYSHLEMLVTQNTKDDICYKDICSAAITAEQDRVLDALLLVKYNSLQFAKSRCKAAVKAFMRDLSHSFLYHRAGRDADI